MSLEYSVLTDNNLALWCTISELNISLEIKKKTRTTTGFLQVRIAFDNLLSAVTL
jgi:hypothetical protein